MAVRVSSDLTPEEFQNLKNQVNDVKTKLESVKSSYSRDVTAIKNQCKSLIDSFGSTWSDEVATKLQSSLNNISTQNMTAIEDDLSSGGFSQIYKVLADLYTYLATASYSKIKYNNAVRNKSLPDDNPNKTTQSDVNARKRELDGYVSVINTLFSNLSTIKFGELSQLSALPEVEAVIEAPPEQKKEEPKEQKPPEKTKRDEIAENFDHEDFVDSMHNLFSWGVFQAQVRYGDHVFWIEDISGGSGREFGFTDAYGNPIPGTPTFTKDQVVYSDSYPDVEEAVIDYLATLE